MPQLSRGEILDRIACGESLRGVNLVRTDLSAMDLARADLAEANLRMAELSRADLREARLTGCFLSGAILTEAMLMGANLVESSMIGTVLKNADLSRADLSAADMTGADLQGAQLRGAFMVGTFLNETDMRGASLSGAYIRMAQMAGSDLSGATLDGADLSYTDLSGVRLDGCSLVSVNLTGANLSASSLTGCNLRGADLTGADLTGCNLTSAKLHDARFAGVKLADTWAEWVDVSPDDLGEERVSLQDVFVGILGRPIAQFLIEGRVSDQVLSVLLAHLSDFQAARPTESDVTLKALHQGSSSTALYFEAEHELSLAAYLTELAELAGKGATELLQKLGAALADVNESPFSRADEESFAAASRFESNSEVPKIRTGSLEIPPSRIVAAAERLKATSFWSSEKAFLILTANRQSWLEATSNPSLTVRPPHGAAIGVDLIRGHFVIDDHRKNRAEPSRK
ncbi:MAG TPA: pentapeptide repeat-containing protein [Blastocatellia bacterium]|nr:pentapeptide repeat-containing protein [Blastocatellia bacterium]